LIKRAFDGTLKEDLILNEAYEDNITIKYLSQEAATTSAKVLKDERANLAEIQLLQQAATAMLVQANAPKQGILTSTPGPKNWRT
jgi:hypothetical protein